MRYVSLAALLLGSLACADDLLRQPAPVEMPARQAEYFVVTERRDGDMLRSAYLEAQADTSSVRTYVLPEYIPLANIPLRVRCNNQPEIFKPLGVAGTLLDKAGVHCVFADESFDVKLPLVPMISIEKGQTGEDVRFTVGFGF